MRKISILEENYMALEQSLAMAIDAADKNIESAVSSMKSQLDKAFEPIKSEKFHMEPSFMEFKSNSKIRELLASVKEKITKAAVVLKDTKSLPLEKSAVISKSFSRLEGKEKGDHDDEVHEVAYFFDKENSNIPDNKENKFELVISNNGSAIKKFGSLQEMFESVSKEIEAGLEGQLSKEKLYQAVEKLVLIDKIASTLV
jgi:hypothetical protein